MKRISKNQYLLGFACVVAFLALVRLIFPSLACSGEIEQTSGLGAGERQSQQKHVGRQRQSGFQALPADSSAEEVVFPSVSAQGNQKAAPNQECQQIGDVLKQHATRFTDAQGQPIKHPILSVPSYSVAFPDSNDVQLSAARKWGVSPVASRQEAEERKNELVYMGTNPYFTVDELHSSIPYLVPRAALLLQDIGQNFFDSLQIKGIPLHHFIVTSVLRSQEDVKKLRGHNKNATENSCHLYGTTFDIGYNRYRRVYNPDQAMPNSTRSDSLKWVLSEVLSDLRKQGRCYVKYERKQSCFHITVR